jgi:hypothetical protein
MSRTVIIFDSLKQNDAAVSSFHIDPLKKFVLSLLNEGLTEGLRKTLQQILGNVG